MKNIETEHDNNIFEDYLKSDEKERCNIKFSNFTSNIKVLGLEGQTNETLELYKDIFMDNFKMTEYFNVIRLSKSDDYIKSKLSETSNNTYDIKLLHSSYYKIKLLRMFENTFNIQPLDVGFEDKNNVEMDDVMHSLIRTVFRTTKTKPSNSDELRKLYISIIKNITNNNIITTTRINTRKEGKRGQYTYSLNKELIIRYLELNKFTNPQSKQFMSVFVKEAVDDNIEFIDDVIDNVIDTASSDGFESSDDDDNDMLNNPLDEGIFWF